MDVGIRYSCDHCYRDISAIPRIQCAECGGGEVPSSGKNNEEVDLCVECFGKGVEFGTHRKDHAYRVIKPLDFAVYEAGWRADEELLLLEAVETHGMGAWLDVADQVASKTAAECEQHYRRLYLDWPGRPLPVHNMDVCMDVSLIIIESRVSGGGRAGGEGEVECGGDVAEEAREEGRISGHVWWDPIDTTESTGKP